MPVLVRELREEIGLQGLPALKRLFKIEARLETGWEFCWVYRCHSEGPFALNPDEIEARRLVHTGKGCPLDRRKSGGFRQRLPAGLEIIFRTPDTKLSFTPLLAAEMR